MQGRKHWAVVSREVLAVARGGARIDGNQIGRSALHQRGIKRGRSSYKSGECEPMC